MSSIIQHDQLLIAESLSILVGQRQEAVRFQLPPKIKDDSRQGDWATGEHVGVNSGEPIVTFKGGEPRKITMDWKYVVGLIPGWDANKVQQQLTLLRRYFVNPGSDPFSDLLVMLKIWGMGGSRLMSCRFHSISIKHGDAMVGTGETAFHLETEISAQLALWPLIQSAMAVPGAIELDFDWY